MKRQKMQLITILGLFLVLVLATFWMKQLQKKEESAGQKSVLSLDKGKVVSFTLSNQSGTLDLKKSGKIWVLEKKKDNKTNQIRVDQAKVQKILEQCSDLKSKKVIQDVKNLEQYGLPKPEMTIRLKMQDRGIKTLKIGSYSSDASAYYATVDEGKTVFLMDASIEEACNVTEKDLQEGNG
ncbi:MAG: DUF4340 domain-containing protein [Lachnospiraceae bacterium]|nr:DUF4340 domain-containing protein [Lachnospiraceae bacterium]